MTLITTKELKTNVVMLSFSNSFKDLISFTGLASGLTRKKIFKTSDDLKSKFLKAEISFFGFPFSNFYCTLKKQCLLKIPSKNRKKLLLKQKTQTIRLKKNGIFQQKKFLLQGKL